MKLRNLVILPFAFVSIAAIAAPSSKRVGDEPVTCYSGPIVLRVDARQNPYPGTATSINVTEGSLSGQKSINVPAGGYQTFSMDFNGNPPTRVLQLSTQTPSTCQLKFVTKPCGGYPDAYTVTPYSMGCDINLVTQKDGYYLVVFPESKS